MRINSKTGFYATSLIAAVAALSSCAKKPGYSDFPPFVNMSRHHYQQIANRLDDSGVQVYKQRKAVQIIIPARKLFYKNTTRINQSFKPKLNDVATLVAHAPNANIKIIGYSNYLPTRHNQYIQSHKYATIVAQQLRKRGVPVTRKLQIIAKANQQPVSGSLTAKGNVQNQRIEVRIN